MKGKNEIRELRHVIIPSSTQPRAKRACVSIVLYRDIHGQNKGEEVRVNVRVKTMANGGGTYGGVVESLCA